MTSLFKLLLYVVSEVVVLGIVSENFEFSLRGGFRLRFRCQNITTASSATVPYSRIVDDY